MLRLGRGGGRVRDRTGGTKRKRKKEKKRKAGTNLLMRV